MKLTGVRCLPQKEGLGWAENLVGEVGEGEGGGEVGKGEGDLPRPSRFLLLTIHKHTEDSIQSCTHC